MKGRPPTGAVDGVHYRGLLLLAIVLGCVPREMVNVWDGGGSGGGNGGCPGCGTGLVCERYGAPACVDPHWAQWPMPNAQLEVAAGAGNLQSYADNHDGTVTDNVTQLMWQQMTPAADYTQAASLAYCAALTLGGHDDWRLPAVIELVSIVDTGTYDPSIDSTVFPGTPAVGFYWSSTSYVGVADNAWGVYFNNGYAAFNEAAMPYSVRCVR
ncbi:MAG: DUF1566 domain-containing protein [Verrucomicrobiota bacterium]